MCKGIPQNNVELQKYGISTTFDLLNYAQNIHMAARHKKLPHIKDTPARCVPSSQTENLTYIT